MNALQRRAGGYGLAALVCGVLVWAGFVRETDPDLGTMESSVEVQLRLASVMPEKDKSGSVVKERESLLASARDYLDRIERVDPESTCAREYRAFLAYLDRDYTGAAVLYRQIRGLTGCSDMLRDQSLINEARMLQMAGRHAEAAELLRASQGGFLAENVETARRELAQATRSSAPGTGAANDATDTGTGAVR